MHEKPTGTVWLQVPGKTPLGTRAAKTATEQAEAAETSKTNCNQDHAKQTKGPVNDHTKNQSTTNAHAHSGAVCLFDLNMFATVEFRGHQATRMGPLTRSD